ncbi:hypothetical protein EIK77_002683 [Talaromyces pinophilus]|nr:hypothetical protein EIK77_002683 [Talaromyces pinophilus]
MLQNLGKPIILTGSQAPMLELQNDASDNLLGSLVVAGHFMIPEVCLYFNYKLFRGNRSTKVAASDFAAFDSPNAPPLAVTTSMRTHVNWDLVHRPTSIENFSIRTNLDTSHVACLRIFPGIKPEMVDAVLQLKGLRGLVLETFGAGNAPGGQDNAMTKVLASLTGHVSPVYAPGMTLFRAGVVAGQDMTTEAALTKLAYLLAMPDSTPESIAKDMAISLRGELTSHSQTVFRHPEGGLSERTTTLTALGYAIAQGDLDKVKDLLKGANDWVVNDSDYAGNTPVLDVVTIPEAWGRLASPDTHVEPLRTPKFEKFVNMSEFIPDAANSNLTGKFLTQWRTPSLDATEPAPLLYTEENWQPLLELLSTLNRVEILNYAVGNSFPRCLLQALHQYHPTCQLNIWSYQNIAPDRPGLGNLFEIDLIRSPCLHAIKVVYPRGYARELGMTVSQDAIISLLMRAPNLRHLQVRSISGGSSIVRSNEEWERFLASFEPTTTTSAHLLTFCFNGEFGNEPIVAKWEEYFDFSNLRALDIGRIKSVSNVVKLFSRLQKLERLFINLADPISLDLNHQSVFRKRISGQCFVP